MFQGGENIVEKYSKWSYPIFFVCANICIEIKYWMDRWSTDEQAASLFDLVRKFLPIGLAFFLQNSASFEPIGDGRCLAVNGLRTMFMPGFSSARGDRLDLVTISDWLFFDDFCLKN